MDLAKIIIDSSGINEDLVVYAKKIEGRFRSSSEAILLELTDEDLDTKADDIASKMCPGFSYFLEVFLIQEMMEDLETIGKQKNMDEKIEAVIHYAEFDV